MVDNPSRRRALTYICVAFIVGVMAPVTASAATGGHFLLGESNSASRTSTLTNSGSGPALSLKNNSAAPPLAVSSSKKVSNLNADLVDGQRAGLTWHLLPLASGLGGGCYDSAPKYAVQFGIVYFQGDMCATTTGQLIFTLPASIRPHRSLPSGTPALYLPVQQCGGSTGKLVINAATGQAWDDVDPANGSGSTCFTSLEGISYPIS